MYALIHNSQLILGPIQFNYRLINSDLEELDIESRVSPRDYENVPIELDSATETFLLPVVEIIPPYDPRFQGVGNFEWNIIREDNIPVRIEMSYSINDRSLEQIKEEYRRQVVPIRKEKENTTIEIELNGSNVLVSTSREDRLSFVSKLMASPGTHNFKFIDGTWLEISTTELEYIISQIDLKVQEAFNWEYQKLQEIDACATGEEVYNVVLREPEQVEKSNALPTSN